MVARSARMLWLLDSVQARMTMLLLQKNMVHMTVMLVMMVALLLMSPGFTLCHCTHCTHYLICELRLVHELSLVSRIGFGTPSARSSSSRKNRISLLSWIVPTGNKVRSSQRYFEMKCKK